MDPPFPVYLFGLISSLKEKSARGYPVKKVSVLSVQVIDPLLTLFLQLLLLYWKTLLTCLGGIRELGSTKKLARELANLPAIPESGQSYLRTT